MQVIQYNSKVSLGSALARPASSLAGIERPVRQILNNVKRNGDTALLAYASKFDKVNLSSIEVTRVEMSAAQSVDAALKRAIKVAYNNIVKFHKAQKVAERKVETMPGVICWRQSKPIQNVGLYIPGGTAPLFSTVLMLGIPAQIAGCQTVVLCTPPDANGNIHPAILYAARLCGIERIYKTGGAQAIAAMAFGTETIPRVDKIFGPGNRYVTTAKQLVQNEGSSFLWNFGDGTYSTEINPKHTYNSFERFTITLVASVLGCADTQSRDICVDYEFKLFIPNVFTPNGDGNNDYFRIYGTLQFLTFTEIKVFTRTGEMVFESNKADFVWDGTYKGTPQEPQVFVYTLRTVFPDCYDESKHVEKLRKGSITLIR